MNTLHTKITDTVREYRQHEALLIDLVQKADTDKLYLQFGYSSLFEYLHENQGISRATVSNLITVARKAVQIPAMKEAISKGEVGLAKMRKVSSVITPENQKVWMDHSRNMTCRDLEKEVARVSTYKPRRDFWQRISSEYLRLSFDASEEFRKLCERAQDVYSKKCQTNRNLEEVFTWALQEVLQRQDPLEKAKRAQNKEKTSVTEKTDLDCNSSGQSGRITQAEIGRAHV